MRDFYISESVLHRYDTKSFRETVSKARRIIKHYELRPLISGTKQLRHHTVVDIRGVTSPTITFVYYERTLIHKVTDHGTEEINLTSAHPKRLFAGGIETCHPQFAAIIHDGYDEQIPPARSWLA